MSTFEEEIARLKEALAVTPGGPERDQLLIALGATVAAEEMTRPERGLAEVIIASQAWSECLPDPDDDYSLLTNCAEQ